MGLKSGGRGESSIKKMSAVQVMAQSAVGATAADRTPFFGVKTPLELKRLVQLSKTVDTSSFKEVVKCKVLGLTTCCYSCIIHTYFMCMSFLIKSCVQYTGIAT